MVTGGDLLTKASRALPCRCSRARRCNPLKTATKLFFCVLGVKICDGTIRGSVWSQGPHTGSPPQVQLTLHSLWRFQVAPQKVSSPLVPRREIDPLHFRAQGSTCFCLVSPETPWTPVRIHLQNHVHGLTAQSSTCFQIHPVNISLLAFEGLAESFFTTPIGKWFEVRLSPSPVKILLHRGQGELQSSCTKSCLCAARHRLPAEDQGTEDHRPRKEPCSRENGCSFVGCTVFVVFCTWFNFGCSCWLHHIHFRFETLSLRLGRPKS